MCRRGCARALDDARAALAATVLIGTETPLIDLATRIASAGTAALVARRLPFV